MDKILHFFDLPNQEFQNNNEAFTYIYHNVSRNEEEIKKIYFKLIDLKIKKILSDTYKIQVTNLDVDIKNILPEAELPQVLRKVRSEIQLKTPQLYLSPLTFIITILIGFIIQLVYWILMLKRIEILMALPFGISICFSIFLCILPIVILAQIFPDFYVNNTLVGIRTYREFIDEILAINWNDLKSDDCNYLKNNIKDMLMRPTFYFNFT